LVLAFFFNYFFDIPEAPFAVYTAGSLGRSLQNFLFNFSAWGIFFFSREEHMNAK
jgi:hypothetical protein